MIANLLFVVALNREILRGVCSPLFAPFIVSHEATPPRERGLLPPRTPTPRGDTPTVHSMRICLREGLTHKDRLYSTPIPQTMNNSLHWADFTIVQFYAMALRGVEIDFSVDKGACIMFKQEEISLPVGTNLTLFYRTIPTQPVSSPHILGGASPLRPPPSTSPQKR